MNHFSLLGKVEELHDKEIKSIDLYTDLIFTVSRDRSLRVCQ